MTNNCPFCGSNPEPRAASYDWTCQSGMEGDKPWQSQACKLNVAEATIERLALECPDCGENCKGCQCYEKREAEYKARIDELENEYGELKKHYAETCYKFGNQAASLIETAKQHYRELYSGGCRMLSKGENCECFLCRMDNERALLMTGKEPTDAR